MADNSTMYDNSTMGPGYHNGTYDDATMHNGTYDDPTM